MLQGTNQRAASFVMLGEGELSEKCAQLLVERFRTVGLLGRFNLLPGSRAEVSVRVHAASLNYKDQINVNAGVSQELIPLSDGAGIVEEAGKEEIFHLTFLFHSVLSVTI